MQVDSGTAGLDVVSPVKTGSLEAEAWMDEVHNDVAACSSLTGRRPKAARHYTYENRACVAVCFVCFLVGLFITIRRLVVAKKTKVLI